MLLDLEDDQVRCRIAQQTNGKLRLTLDYPHTAEYRRRVMTAVSDLIRPKTQQSTAVASANRERPMSDGNEKASF